MTEDTTTAVRNEMLGILRTLQDAEDRLNKLIDTKPKDLEAWTVLYRLRDTMNDLREAMIHLY